MDIALVVGALILLFVHLLSVALTTVRLKRTPLPTVFASSKPPVSLVIPLRGIENFTPLTISRAFTLDWPNYEIIFCVADRNDPAIKQVQLHLAAFPHISARVLIGDDRISANPKLNNCVKGWRAAGHDWVVLADSNVLMPSDYIASLMAAWRNDTGLVCSPPIGSRPQDLWAEVECCFLNTFQARYQYSAEASGNGFAQGKTMLWNKPFLEARGGHRGAGSRNCRGCSGHQARAGRRAECTSRLVSVRAAARATQPRRDMVSTNPLGQAAARHVPAVLRA